MGASKSCPPELGGVEDIRGAKLLVDTNIFVDYLGKREPNFRKARLLMIAGEVREFQLWMSATQVTDLLYILSNGGNKDLLPKVTQAVERLLDFVSVYATSQEDVRAALCSGWDDPEDAFIHQVAVKLAAAAIITRNGGDFAKSLVPVYDCDEFFNMLKERGLEYEEIKIA